MGVAFHEGPTVVTPGEEIEATLCLIFYPHPAYDKLQPGVTFTVRQGVHIVGFGVVQRWLV